MVIITPIFAALLTILYLNLSISIIKQRRKAQVALGDGDDSELLRRIRVQANFNEYVPMSLILLAFAEHLGANWILMHVLCLMLLIGRIAHAYGVSKSKENFKFRIAGMVLTFSVLAASALSIFVLIGLHYLA